jgi:hypothetical protein
MTDKQFNEPSPKQLAAKTKLLGVLENPSSGFRQKLFFVELRNRRNGESNNRGIIYRVFVQQYMGRNLWPELVDITELLLEIRCENADYQDGILIPYGTYGAISRPLGLWMDTLRRFLGKPGPHDAPANYYGWTLEAATVVCPA